MCIRPLNKNAAVHVSAQTKVNCQCQLLPDIMQPLPLVAKPAFKRPVQFQSCMKHPHSWQMIRKTTRLESSLIMQALLAKQNPPSVGLTHCPRVYSRRLYSWSNVDISARTSRSIVIAAATNIRRRHPCRPSYIIYNI